MFPGSKIIMTPSSDKEKASWPKLWITWNKSISDSLSNGYIRRVLIEKWLRIRKNPVKTVLLSKEMKLKTKQFNVNKQTPIPSHITTSCTNKINDLTVSLG